MSVPQQNYLPKSTVDPLEDDELSDLTKHEIIFWCKKLNLTPYQLFSLPKDELDQIMQKALRGANLQQAQEQYEHLEQESENKKKDRLKGGVGPDIWQILGQAAQAIEQTYGHCDTVDDRSYGTTDESQLYYTEDESNFESSPEDSFFIDSYMASTQKNARARNPTDKHPCPSRADATYNVAEQYAAGSRAASNPTYNTTYDVPRKGRNVTYRCPGNSFNIPDISSPSGVDADTDNWSPQQMHFIDDSEVISAPSFRKYTDYSIEYSPRGTEEMSNSVSVENYDETSGKVTASSRTFTLPPASSPATAMELSNISPPALASGCLQRAAKGLSRVQNSDLSNISQPLLASGCINRNPISSENQNISPPTNAAGYANRHTESVSPSRVNSFKVSPPTSASGCYKPTACSGKQFRDTSPSTSHQPTDGSFNRENVSMSQGMPSPSQPRCPFLSAERATTPKTVKPNRPYCPRRIF